MSDKYPYPPPADAKEWTCSECGCDALWCGCSRRTVAVMVTRVSPEKWVLPDGRLGTEWEALMASIKILEAKKRYIEEDIELLRTRLAMADGQP